MLHTTGLDSEGVRAGKCCRLILYKRPADPADFPTTLLPDRKLVEITELIQAVGDAIDRFVNSLSQSSEKMATFNDNWRSRFVPDAPSVRLRRHDEEEAAP